IMPEDRTRSVEQLRNEFSASPAAAAAGNNYISQHQHENSAPKEEGRSASPASKAKKSSKKGGVIAFVAGLAACVLIFTVLWFTVIRDRLEPVVGITTTVGQDQGFFDKIKSFFAGDGEVTVTTVAPDEKIEVPKLVGRSYIDVKNLYVSKFEFVATFQYSSTVAQGLIISQTVSEGTMLQRGSTIDVVVSSGYEWIKLPTDLSGKTYTEVYNQLAALGLTCERQDIFNDGTKTKDIVSAVMSESMRNGEVRKDVKVIIMAYGEPVTETTPEAISETPAEAP
ncbi:MAG: PASTA domain-containing protein, partial [Clostridiales bacterium]|nr:PASTA domain-containing protein [Clostridiales bacterium]